MGTVSFFPSFFSRCFFKPKATFSLQPLETGIQAFYYPNSLRGILTKHRRSLTVPLNELNFHRSNSLPVASICLIYVTFYSIRLLIALCGNQIVRHSLYVLLQNVDVIQNLIIFKSARHLEQSHPAAWH